eukprot:600858-Rhodomonas_salina.1
MYGTEAGCFATCGVMCGTVHAALRCFAALRYIIPCVVMVVLFTNIILGQVLYLPPRLLPDARTGIRTLSAFAFATQWFLSTNAPATRCPYWYAAWCSICPRMRFAMCGTDIAFCASCLRVALTNAC